MAMNKKGVFFTIDSILAAGIIFSVIVYASSLYVNEQPSFNLNYLSQDIIKTLSILTVEEVDNEYLNERIANGDITNPDNTILEQIAEFWAKDDEIHRGYANKTTSNVTDIFIPNTMGFGLWINDESIYTRDIPIKKSLISSKKLISGISKDHTTEDTRKNPPVVGSVLVHPVIIEVRVWN